MVDMTFEEYMGEPFKMTYDGVDLSEYFYVAEVTGRSLSRNEILSVKKPDGNYRFKKKRKKPVPLVVRVILVNETEGALRNRINALNSMLNTEKPASITFSDEPDFTYYGILSDVSEGIEVKGNHIATLTFWREEAYKYKTAHNLTVGIEFDTHTIEGQAEAVWTSETTFTADQTNYIIENNEGGKITLNYNFIAGDVLEIDYKKRKITLNDASLAVALSFSSHWFALKPGLILLKASHETTISYTGRWF